MNQVEIDDKIQEAKEYDAKKYLTLAVGALKRNRKVDIEIVDYE